MLLKADGPTATAATGCLEFIERLYENGTDGVLAFDEDLRLIFWNPVMEALSGRTRREALGRSAFDAFPALRAADDGLRLRETLLGRASIAADTLFGAGAHGRSERYDVYHVPLHGPDGRVIGGVAILRGVRAKHRADQRLHESESRFRTMADCAPVLLWMSGTDALCDFFNQGWLDFTGRPLEQEMGVGWAEGVHPEDFQGCMDRYMAAFNARKPFEMVYRLRRADGEFRWILDRGTPRHTPDGAFAGYIGSCIDITDRKIAEDALKKTADDLARSNLDLERFAHVAAHDLQEPLRMVANFTELLAAKCRDRLDDQALEYVRFAVEGAQRMKELIDGLITFSRIGEAPAASFRSTSCSAVMEEVLADLRLSVQESGAVITQDPLPDVRGDRAYLNRLFRNLIQNSITFHGSEPARVHVSATARGSFWLFSVKDNGIGFDMRFAERIFVIFQRLHRREEREGHGVGLTICKKIVEAHGGRIWAESKPGDGTVISFTLPADLPTS